MVGVGAAVTGALCHAEFSIDGGKNGVCTTAHTGGHGRLCKSAVAGVQVDNV
jgi:hypothetical protein